MIQAKLTGLNTREIGKAHAAHLCDRSGARGCALVRVSKRPSLSTCEIQAKLTRLNTREIGKAQTSHLQDRSSGRLRACESVENPEAKHL